MTDEEIGTVNKMLWSKPAQQSLTLDEMREVYYYVLEPIASEYVPALIRWILLECKTWRPTTDAIYDFIQRISGHGPATGQAVIAEIKAAIREYGRHGRRDRQMPGVRYEGAPPLSEAAIAFVAARGGWVAFCGTIVKNEDFFWREAEREAAAICDEVKLTDTRQAMSLKSQPSLASLPPGIPEAVAP